MPNWSAPLWRARRDDWNGYIICIHRSPDERDMHRTSCGFDGIHMRPHGDVLHTGCHVSMKPHQCKRSTSRRIGWHHVFSTRIEGSTTRANYLQLTYTSGIDHGTHLVVTQMKEGPNGANPGSADPTLRRFAPIFHISVDPKRIPGVLCRCFRPATYYGEYPK
jgi:hypothetical protein